MQFRSNDRVCMLIDLEEAENECRHAIVADAAAAAFKSKLGIAYIMPSASYDLTHEHNSFSKYVLFLRDV